MIMIIIIIIIIIHHLRWIIWELRWGAIQKFSKMFRETIHAIELSINKNLIWAMRGPFSNKETMTAPKLNILNPKISGLGRCFSFSKGVFSGSMLVFGGVTALTKIINTTSSPKGHISLKKLRHLPRSPSNPCCQWDHQRRYTTKVGKCRYQCLQWYPPPRSPLPAGRFLRKKCEKKTWI